MRAGGNRFFIDANVLLYAVDSRDSSKQHSAIEWRNALWEDAAGRLSWQVLNEFYTNATRKLSVPAATARVIVESYAEWSPLDFTIDLLRRAWHWTERAGLSYWDGLILASAERSGCQWLLSEDFQAGRRYGSVEIVNPFETHPEQFFRTARD